MMYAQHSEDSLDASRSTQQMPNGTLRATRIDLGCVILAVLAEHKVLDGSILCGVAKCSTRRMCVDIIDSTRPDTSMPKCVFHCEAWTLAILAGCCHVVRIAGEAIACDLSVYVRASSLCMFEFLA
jgi:hypothetical protein